MNWLHPMNKIQTLSSLYRYRHWLVIFWLLAFVAYHMAWTSHNTAAFTLNAFDLAEQIRVHPAIAAENPALRTVRFLRLPIPIIAAGLHDD